MRYYVVSDTHSFYGATLNAIGMAGFFTDSEPHKLILCGDMMDRGDGSVQMEELMEDLLDEGRLIFIKGNHEELMEDMVEDFEKYREAIAWGYSHHVSNGTWKTALALTGMTETEALLHPDDFKEQMRDTVFYSKLIPASVDYFETKNHVFVHGWIPFRDLTAPGIYSHEDYAPMTDFREAPEEAWSKARWVNGMEMWHDYDIRVPSKQVVCGHWHASYGHSRFDRRGPEFGPGADFTPFERPDILAIDACTAASGDVNCVVIED